MERTENYAMHNKMRIGPTDAYLLLFAIFITQIVRRRQFYYHFYSDCELKMVRDGVIGDRFGVAVVVATRKQTAKKLTKLNDWINTLFM